MKSRFWVACLGGFLVLTVDSLAMCVAPYMRLVQVKFLSCSTLSDHRAEVVSKWKQEFQGYRAEVFKEEMDHVEDMLDHNQGIIVHVQVLRERELWSEEVEGKPSYRASMWKELEQPRDYYYQTSKHHACKQFESEESVTLFAGSSCCDMEPPVAIDCLLGMKVLSKPPKWSREFIESPGK